MICRDGLAFLRPSGVLVAGVSGPTIGFLNTMRAVDSYIRVLGVLFFFGFVGAVRAAS